MKKVLALLVVLFLLTACSPQPQITDTGKPGQIQVITFYDDNHNGARDQGEAGVSDQVMVVQDSTCPPSHISVVPRIATDSKGETLVKDLKPGQYCVGYLGDLSIFTSGAQTVNLSSDQIVQVLFGLGR